MTHELSICAKVRLRPSFFPLAKNITRQFLWDIFFVWENGIILGFTSEPCSLQHDRQVILRASDDRVTRTSNTHAMHTFHKTLFASTNPFNKFINQFLLQHHLIFSYLSIPVTISPLCRLSFFRGHFPCPLLLRSVRFYLRIMWRVFLLSTKFRSISSGFLIHHSIH